MAEFTWGSDKKAVAITEHDAKSLVAAIVEAVTKDRQAELIAQFQQFALQGAEVARLREQVTALVNENAGLRQHIATLNNFLVNMAPGSPQNPAGLLPTYPERQAAQAPLPYISPQAPAFAPSPNGAPSVPIPPKTA